MLPTWNSSGRQPAIGSVLFHQSVGTAGTHCIMAGSCKEESLLLFHIAYIPSVRAVACTCAPCRQAPAHGSTCLKSGLLCSLPAVVTTIHDCQLLEEEIDGDKMMEWDVPVDIIVTPTQVGNSLRSQYEVTV